MSTNENSKNKDDLLTKVKENAKDPDTWIPVLFLIVFGLVILFPILFWIILLLFCAQFICKLVTGDTNKQLEQLNSGLAQYILQILLYITYTSKQRPFPLGPWPGTGGGDEGTSPNYSGD
jgi:hypothetical protein